MSSDKLPSERKAARGRPRRAVSLTVGALLGGSIVAAAVAAVWLLGGPEMNRAAGTPGGAPTAFVKPEDEAWYLQHLPQWKGMPFVSLDDGDALRTAVAAAVQDRYPGPDLDEEALARDLTAFLHMLAAPDAAEYVRRCEADDRRLRTATELYEDSRFHAAYRGVAGQSLAPEADPVALFERFWRAAENGAGHPRSVATMMAVQAAWSKPVPADRPPGSVLASLMCPQYSMYERPELASSIGPFSAGFARLTMPLASFEAAAGAQPRVLMCDVRFVVRTSEDRIFPVAITFFLDPVGARWHAVLAGAGYPYDEALWPL